MQENILEEIRNSKVEWKSLGEIASLFNGLTGKNKANFENGNAKYISYKNIFSNIEINFNDLEKVQISENEKQNEVKYGDILFTNSSETASELGFSSAITEKFQEKIYLNSFSFGLRFHENIVLIPEFAKYLFRCDFMRKEIQKTGNGVTRINLSKEKFKKIKIPLPSLELQNKIVEILDKFTELQKELQKELKKEEELRKKQYEFYREKLLTFGDEVERKTLGEIGSVKMCKRILKDQTTEKGEIPFYKIGTFGKKADSFISREIFEEYKNKYSYPKVGEILISASGTIGRTVIFDGKDSYFQDSNIVWLANDENFVLNKFLFHFYKIAKWNISEGGTISRLYNDDLRKLKIPIPPIEKQKEIVEILDKFETLTNSIKEGLPREIELRQKQYEYYRNLLLDFKE